MTPASDPSRLAALVVGLGSAGLRHLENLRSLGVTRLGALRRREAPLFRDCDLDGVALHRDLDQALAAGYDLVVIANPTALHLDIALPAARAGCHLYLEKPVGNTLAGTGELADLVARKGLKVQVGCQLRFHPNLLAVKGWLEEGRLGRVLAARVDCGEYLPGWHPWEDYRRTYTARRELGGGVLLTTIHEIDYLHWLLGPLAVQAARGGISGALELNVDDHVSAFLTGKDGQAVILQLDFLQRPPCRELKIIGARGQVRWDYFAGRAELWVDGELAGESLMPAGFTRNDLFRAALADCLGAVLTGREPRVPLKEGLATLEVALTIMSRLDLPGNHPERTAR